MSDDDYATVVGFMGGSEYAEDAALALDRLHDRAQAFASLVALADRSSVLSANLAAGVFKGPANGLKWCVTVEFNSGELLDAVADTPEAAVEAAEAKMQEREDIQSGYMEDT